MNFNISPKMGKRNHLYESVEVLETNSLSDNFLQSMPPAIRICYVKARAVKMGNRIEMSSKKPNGENLFDNNDLEEDLKRVRGKIEKINKEGKTLLQESMTFGEIFEGLFASTKWFGHNSKIIIPSLFDDLYLGNDLILEHTINNKDYSITVIDLTVGEEASLNKMEYLRRKLLKGDLGSIKYFKSLNSEFAGEVYGLPNFIIGLDRRRISELSLLWSENKMKEINSSPLQFNLFFQMKVQAEYFIKLITDKKSELEKKQNKTETEEDLLFKYKNCLNVYSQELLKINTLIKEKEKRIGLEFSLFNINTNKKLFDGVSSAIMSFCKKRDSLPDVL